MSADGTVLDEYVTLINPGRDIGRTDIHGIRAGDVLDAPTFADVMGDICSRVQGAIVGGHNVEFDARFIDAELKRAGHVLPAVKLLCSMRALGGSLASCCRDYEIDIGQAHSALHDAPASKRRQRSRSTTTSSIAYWRTGALAISNAPRSSDWQLSGGSRAVMRVTPTWPTSHG